MVLSMRTCVLVLHVPVHPRFVDRCAGDQFAQLSRSLFGLVRVWNKLFVHIVEITSVKVFHSKLTRCARKACEDEHKVMRPCIARIAFPAK